MNTVIRFMAEENGQTLSEYALILSIMILSVIGALTTLGPKISDLFSNVSNKISQI